MFIPLYIYTLCMIHYNYIIHNLYAVFNATHTAAKKKREKERAAPNATPLQFCWTVMYSCSCVGDVWHGPSLGCSTTGSIIWCRYPPKTARKKNIYIHRPQRASQSTNDAHTNTMHIWNDSIAFPRTSTEQHSTNCSGDECWVVQKCSATVWSWGERTDGE